MKPVLYSLIIVLFGTGFVFAAEFDDSSLFIEAFTAYQKKDYLLTIERIETLRQLFPDTPLRDVALLLLARAGINSGDNQLAAKTISQFNSEFAASPLKATAELELLRLGARWQKGEKLSPTLPLQAAARKTRNDQLALTRLLPQKTGLEQLPARQAPGDRTALASTSPELPLAAAIASQESVRSVISLPGGQQTVAVGQHGTIPFEIFNKGKMDESYVLEAAVPSEYEAVFMVNNTPVQQSMRVTVGTADSYKGSIAFHMPSNKVDGHKATFSLRAISETDRRVVQSQETRVITSAPLVRVVARPEKQNAVRGKSARYRLSILNAGTLPAQGLTVRVLLPPQIEFLSAQGTPYLRESPEAIVFTMDRLPTGKLEEFTMDVMIRENSLIGQELRCKVEVQNSLLLQKEIFTSSPVEVQGK